MAKKARKRFILAAAFAVPAVLAAVFLLRRETRDFAGLRKGRDFNVILITVDTLRADRIGCYGFNRAETPAMDLFASRGVKFERCLAQTPLTLPSHTTLLTGTLPIFHGIRDNGGFVVPAQLETMAELFKARGYSTAAFVGAYVLDSKWGLNQGFDTYFDKFDLSRFEKISLASVQRPANEVVDEALAWLDKSKTGKFFAWIHLYDPHTPYEPPAPFDLKYPNHPYLGEIAFTDTQLARLWSYLETNGLVDNLFLVFASDHGESLGEHEESTHGFFVYQEAIHVPLIVVTPFPPLQGTASARIASLVDVLPTVCEMNGMPVPREVQGRSLVSSFFDPEEDAEGLAYSETFYPRFHYGWSELKSIQDKHYKLILAPVPELYDLAADPEETKNLVYLNKDVFDAMSAEASRFMETAGQNALETDIRKVDEDTREKLAALGYIGSFTDPSKLAGRKLANPRDKIGVFNEISRAREMGMGGEVEEAIQILKAIVAEDPEVGDVYFSMGNIYFKERKYSEAVEAFIQALEKKPDDSFAVINIANSYLMMGKPGEAERFIIDYLGKGFADPQLYYLLGNISYRTKDYDKAISYFQRCLSGNAESASSHNALAAIYLLRDDLVKAEEHLRAAQGLNPRLASVYYNEAQLLEKQGRLAEAEAAYLREIEYTPGQFKAMYNLARLYREAGRQDDELVWLQRTIEANPDFPLSYFFLARIHLNRGQDYEKAVELVKKGLELKPDKADLPLGYFLLADLYNRLGNDSLSREYAQKGQEAAAGLAPPSR